MKVICIAQARMGSTRLPGKVLQRIDNVSLLATQATRIARAQLVDKYIIATTDQITDAPLIAHLHELDIPYSRGSEHDVLGRYYQTALEHGCKEQDLVVRITSDCPFICPELVDCAIRAHQQHASADYTYLDLRHLPRGLDVEVFSFAALTLAHQEAEHMHEREHVTPFFYNQPKRFTLNGVRRTTPAWQHYRLCVDEHDDFAMIAKLKATIEASGRDWQSISGEQICELLDQHPDLSKINQQVMQKCMHS
jgi:spore coat polysaccharide biosynthesis protein SpsF